MGRVVLDGLMHSHKWCIKVVFINLPGHKLVQRDNHCVVVRIYFAGTMVLCRSNSFGFFETLRFSVKMDFPHLINPFVNFLVRKAAIDKCWGK